MVDLLGPADAGSVNTLSTTGDVTAPVAGDSWFQDCSGGVAGTGTDEVAKYLNRLLQQLRVAIRAAGVPLANSYDAMLSWAMQSGLPNFIGAAGGTANALTGSVDNSPTAIPDGTCFWGYAAAANTGPATFNLQALGALPILLPDGVALSGGEINGIFGVLKDGSNWFLISPPQSQAAPFSETSVGALIVVSASGTGLWSLTGATGTWSGTDAAAFMFSGYSGAFGQSTDIRIPNGGPTFPGTWQIITASSVGDEGGGVCTLKRIE